jgi:selenocysteine-specific elongation factor
VVSLLHREESGSDAERVLGAVAAHPAGTTVAATAAETGLEPAAVRTAADALVQSGRVLSLGAERLVGADAVEALAATARSLLAEFHRTHPLRWGMSRGELKSRLGRSLAADLFERVLQGLESTGEVHLRRDLVRRGGPELEPTAAEAAWVERVRAALDAGGLSPQLLKELARTLGADPGEALECLTFQGLVEKVTPELYVSRHHLDRLRTWIEDRFRDRPQLAVGDLREAFGLSRKYSVPILELFDRQGLTRRHGDVRVAGKGT